MKTEQIFEMAIQAGFEGCAELTWENVICTEELVTFAKLVAKHTLLNTDPSSFMSYQEGVEVGRMAEREACAKLCEEMAVKDNLTNYYKVALNAIRARGHKEVVE